MKKASERMTAKLVKKIKNLLKTNQYHQHQIAAIVDVNPGRVSETKNGKWDYLIDIDNNQPSLF